MANGVLRAVQAIGGDRPITHQVIRVALECDVSVGTVYAWLKAGSVPRTSQAVALAKAAEAAGDPVPIADLVGMND